MCIVLKIYLFKYTRARKSLPASLRLSGLGRRLIISPVQAPYYQDHLTAAPEREM